MPLHLVFLSPAAQGGGAEAALLELLRALREARPAWTLHLLAGEDGPLLAKARALGAGAETLPFPAAVQTLGENRRDAAAGGRLARLVGWLRAAGGALLYAWRLRARLRRLRPDVIHSNGMKMHLLGALAKGRAPLVWHLHDYLGARPAMKPLLRRLSGRCRGVVANSGSVAADARAVLPGLPVRAAYNAVDPAVFTPDGPALDLDRLAGWPPAPAGTVRVGLVATFAHWKGHEVFLRAAARVAHKPDARFYVVGGPVYATGGSQRTLAELQDLAGTLGLGGRVGFTGFVEDAPGAMRALDAVVHASTQPEPFGLVIVQAMACGRAVVAAAAGGAAELVSPEADALVHAPGDVDGLADAIARLAADAGLRARLGAAGCAKVRRDFTRARLAETLVPMYETLAAYRP